MAYCTPVLINGTKSCWWLTNACVERKQDPQSKYFYSGPTVNLFCFAHGKKSHSKNLRGLENYIHITIKTFKNNNHHHTFIKFFLVIRNVLFLFLWLFSPLLSTWNITKSTTKNIKLVVWILPCLKAMIYR